MNNAHRLALPVVLLAIAAGTGCRGDKKGEVFFGDDLSYQVQGNGSTIDSDIGAGHDPNEPAEFDARWVGMEAYETLNSARRGELPYSQVRTVSGVPCLLFHKDRLVRRILIGSGRKNDPTQEYTFSQAGNIVLWFRSDRRTPATLDWAYFHRNSRLALYQVQRPGQARSNEQAPGSFAQDVFEGARQCLNAFGSMNPDPGVYNGPAGSEPQQPAPQDPVPFAPPPVQPAPNNNYNGNNNNNGNNNFGAPVRSTAPARPAAASQPSCSGNEVPCSLRDGRIGWCKNAVCKDVCGAGLSYSPLDTDCHKRCNSSCRSCMDGLCFN